MPVGALTDVVADAISRCEPQVTKFAEKHRLGEPGPESSGSWLRVGACLASGELVRGARADLKKMFDSFVTKSRRRGVSRVLGARALGPWAVRPGQAGHRPGACDHCQHGPWL